MRKTCGCGRWRGPWRRAGAATGQRLGLAVEVLGEVEDVGRLLDPRVDLRLRPPGDLEREAHVRRDAHVRVERVVLEHHRDVPVARVDVGHVAVADADGSAVDRLEAGEHAQRGGLAAAGRADQDEELAVADLEVERVDRGAVEAGVATGGSVEGHSCHGHLLHRQERAGRSEWRVRAAEPYPVPGVFELTLAYRLVRGDALASTSGERRGSRRCPMTVRSRR
jgi:hypothetical protein